LAGWSSRVYVVETDSVVRESLAALLDSAGISSRLFSSAETLLEAFDAQDAGCVTADCDGKGEPGLRLLGILRGLGHAVPVILFSAADDAETRRRAGEAGAAALLIKPADPGHFIHLVRSLIAA
jgi:FixJ family two-component response regulator